MSGKMNVTIVQQPNTLEVVTGIQGRYPRFQYSTDGSSWHETYAGEDIYLRISVDGGTTWTSAMRFVGNIWDGGTSDPSSELGDDGDWYVNRSSWHVFEKVAGSWVDRGTLKSTVEHWVTFVVSGNGVALSPGLVEGDVCLPASVIQEVRLYADQAGSIVVDIWKDVHANTPPTSADSICGSSKPTLTSAQKMQDTTLDGWTKTISSGDVFRINIDSCSTIKSVSVILKLGF